MSPEGFRARLGDGYFVGFYAFLEEDLAKVWSVAVEETRVRIHEGW